MDILINLVIMLLNLNFVIRRNFSKDGLAAVAIEDEYHPYGLLGGI